MSVLLGTCEWCGSDNMELEYYSDADEGKFGPQYKVCKFCIERDKRMLNEEFILEVDEEER